MITFDDIRNSAEIRAYMDKGNANLGVLGYTEHGMGHAMKTAVTASDILQRLGYGERECELARIAGYMHDIGNCINRNDHAHLGASMAFPILRDMGMEPAEIAVLLAAIGNHDEKTGTAVDPVSAALILADKTDVRRSRVRAQSPADFDIHDRVNYAVFNSSVTIDGEAKTITLDIELDERMSSVLDYFEIFTERMLMCRRAAQKLGCRFHLTANGGRLL